MANNQTSPMDATGRAVEEAAKKRAKELSERADEISLSRQLEKQSLLNDVFDPKAPDQPLLIDEIESVGVAVNNDTVVIRTTTDIEQMTYGVVNGVPQEYNFKAGAKYKVSKDLAIYLNNLGYVSMIG